MENLLLFPRQDGQIDWKKPAKEIYDFVRALTRPYPGARSSLYGETWYIWKCGFIVERCTQDEYSCGECIGPLISFEKKACGQAVKTGDGIIIITEAENKDQKILSGPDLCELDWNGGKWIYEK